MSRTIEPHRLQLQSYPHQLHIETQFGEMDAYGHINNLAIGRYLESARARLQLELFSRQMFQQGMVDYMIMLAENSTRFLAECNFPEPVAVGTAIDRIGQSSFQFAQALFQNDRCVALCTTVMVYTCGGRSAPLPDQVRARMQSVLIREPGA